MNSRRRSKRKSKQTDGTQPAAIAESALGNHERIRPKPNDYGLLPCLIAGSHRWWLPCDAATSLLLAEIALSHPYNYQHPGSSGIANRVKKVLKQNAPLFLFSVFHLTTQSRDEDHYSLNDLANWLVNNLPDHLTHGDSFLASPLISEDLCARWSRLHTYFQTLPIAKWAEQMHLWLEITGPPIPAKNRRQWCGYVDDEDLPTDEQRKHDQSATHTLLERLSRQRQQLCLLESEFDKQVQASKSDAIKQLAYGLSHEINNPLANISARAQQLQRDETDPARSASLQRISDQVYRAHEMIADLMFYANPPSKEEHESDIGIIAKESANKYEAEANRRSIKIDVNIETVRSCENPSNEHASHRNHQPRCRVSAMVDPLMIGEAIGALIRNAIEAISDGGRIGILVHETESALFIEVADSGPGLSEQARKNAFDPYFSGREAGRGLGLGLCRVARIAELHGGTAEITGSIVGCIARITLPR